MTTTKSSIRLVLAGRPDDAGAIRLAEALSRRHGNDIHVTAMLDTASARQAVSVGVQRVLGPEYEWPVTSGNPEGDAAVLIAVARLDLAPHPNVPVIAVPPWVTTLPNNAVVATDFGSSSLTAAQLALDCLAAPSTLTLLHVGSSVAVESFGQMIDHLDVRPGVEIKTAVVPGNPVTEILAFAERGEADLIAVGGAGGVASRVLRGARCTVIVAPSTTD